MNLASSPRRNTLSGKRKGGANRASRPSAVSAAPSPGRRGGGGASPRAGGGGAATPGSTGPTARERGGSSVIHPLPGGEQARRAQLDEGDHQAQHHRPGHRL